MRTLFWKIFLSFWAVVAAFTIVGILFFRPEAHQRAWQNLVSDAFTIEAQHLAQEYEKRADPELGRVPHHPRQGSYGQMFLFDAAGSELVGPTVPSEARDLAKRAAVEGQVEFARSGDTALFAERVVSTTGGQYAAVGRFSHVPGLTGPPLLRGLAVAIAISGIICFWLARYLSAPIVRLRNAAQELAGGNLAARAGKQRSNRHDEMAQLVQEFDRMAVQIESLMSAQKRLISDVSHEFGSPLTRINLATELIRKVDDPSVTTAIARIEREIERLNGMISNLLTLSKIDACESLADKKTIDVADLLQTIVDDTDFEAHDHNCRVILYGSEDCSTIGNPDLLRSAVENVIRNAIRYTAWQTEVEVRLACETNGAASEATISVRDHGPGVPEASLEELFRPFFRLDESRERSTGGVGLGLAIAQRAVKLHGGEIKAQNCAGRGLEVIISFPVPSSAPLLLHTS
jgi:two-component system, OmpR family, sensor histidine kinase CpxA